ncbi:rust resistance kinase Lr10-like [Magnolia sinica]|uniref:rust resistance kinase Lr10-like n=1 Tax=Magnolia sinica TaxID=86752 RepID=UPI0026592329|nr:rust resistance kinase Lr10-like [Magnolia sinica]
MASPETPIENLLLIFLSLLSLTLFFSTTTSQDNPTLSTDPFYYYNLCAPSKCNGLNLSYPFSFHRFCQPPILQSSCPNNQYLVLSNPHAPERKFRVVRNFTSDSKSASFTVASQTLFSCGKVSFPSYTDRVSIFSLAFGFTWATHFNCTSRAESGSGLLPASCLGCPGQDKSSFCYYEPGFVTRPGCEEFLLITPLGFNVSAERDLRAFLQKGYRLRYAKPLDCQGCEASGGRCGSHPLSTAFVCYCPSSVDPFNCSDGTTEDLQTWVTGGGSGPSKVLIAAVSASSAIFILVLALLATLLVIRRRKMKQESKDETGISSEAVAGISPTRYSYSQLKKFTKNFSTKLGEGAFGSVYKGTIDHGPGGVDVAIKLLKVSKQSEKQFMTEVATVGRVHHNNLVRMLGYCVDRTRRALVYEYMEMGSLDKYIRRTNNDEECTNNEEEHSDFKQLSTKQMYNITLETARGIWYLHQGCRSRILHCDIKPHNILLDSNFSAKVADFGLAKMIDKDHSHVSLTGGQGTPGYAAPEMWSQLYGPVTEKSDVYSYGMLVLEMVGGRRNYDQAASASSREYFPEWAFNRIERGEVPLLREVRKKVGDDKEDMQVVEKLCKVGLWCIQHVHSNRPTMGRVIQMLEGDVDGIEMPPHPFPRNDAEGLFGLVESQEM